MFSPAMMRHIIDPDNITEISGENAKEGINSFKFAHNTRDHKKVLSDCSYFSRLICRIGEVYTIILVSVNWKKCAVKESSGLHSL